jgi:hypothetical protein
MRAVNDKSNGTKRRTTLVVPEDKEMASNALPNTASENVNINLHFIQDLNKSIIFFRE